MIATIAIIIVTLALAATIWAIVQTIKDIKRKRRFLYVGARWHRRDSGESGKITALFWSGNGIIDEVAWSSNETDSRLFDIREFLCDWEPAAK